MKILCFVLFGILQLSSSTLFCQNEKLDVTISNYHFDKKYLVVDFVLTSHDSVLLKFYGGDNGFTLNCDDYWFTNHYVVLDEFNETNHTYQRLHCSADIDFIYNIENMNDSVVFVTEQPMQRQLKLRLGDLADGNYQLAIGQVFFYQSMKQKTTSQPIYFTVNKHKSNRKQKVVTY